MKRTILSATFIVGTLLVTTPAMAQYVFTCVPPTDHVIGEATSNVLAILDTSGSMGQFTDEDVDGDGNKDRKIKVASLAITDVAHSIYTPGSCSNAADPNCDSIRLGLGFFGGSSATLEEACGEDTAPAIISALTSVPTDDITPTQKAMALLGSTPSLNDSTRPNLAVIITDGEPTGSRNPSVPATDLAVARDAFTNACAVANRPMNPVTIYMVGFGSGSFPAINSAMAAAGNTGHCCSGMAAPCPPANQVDVCALGAAGLIKTNTTLQDGYSCTGSFEATGSDIKEALLTVLSGASCVFPLDFPAGYPAGGANADQDATEVKIYHKVGGPISIPPAGRGDVLPKELRDNWSVSNTDAEKFKDEGWEFTNSERKFIRLTPQLCGEVVAKKVSKVTTEVACACPNAGKDCTLPIGTFTPSQLAVMRCSAGKYTCVGIQDVCEPGGTPMPETCNGLDDDCDGSVDNMAESWTSYPSVTLPANRIGIDCNQRDVCMCPDGAKDNHGGTDLMSYFDAWDPVCQCGEGLLPETVNATPDSAQLDSEPDRDADADGAACSSVGGGGGLSLLLLAAFGLVRRRLSR